MVSKLAITSEELRIYDSQSQGEIVLCQASPTYEDGIAFAGFLDIAAEGFFRFMLGRKFAEVIANTFANPKHDFSCQNVIFAKQQGRIVGMASGFTGQQHHRCSDKFLVEAEGFPWFRMWCIQMMLGPLWRFMDTVDNEDFYLQAVAVDKSVRGKGVGSFLIDAMEKRAIESNSKRFALDVASKNESARRLYERRGMLVVATWPKRFACSFRVCRMVKQLRPASGDSTTMASGED